MNATPSTILLTGVTGQVGSELAKLLQKEGYRMLYLIRSSNGQSAADRLRAVLPEVREGLDIAIEGDVVLPNAGLSEDEIMKHKWRVDKIVHCAAAISFEDSQAEFTRKVNVGGTQNMLDLAGKLEVNDFGYVSTAYIAGSAREFGEDDFLVEQVNFNEYEKSKIEAEKLVRSWRGGNFTVYRIPIVLGDSKTGHVLTFHSYYGFLIPFWRLLQTWKKRLEADPAGCAENGVTMEGDKLVLPLYVDCSPVSILNMVPVDWLVLMMSKLLKFQSNNQTYHIVHDDPPKVMDCMNISLSHLGITGVYYEYDKNKTLSSILQRIQAGIDKGINKYRQYIKHGPVFKSDHLVRALGNEYVSPSKIDENMLHTMLDYAMSVDFGK